MSDVSRITTTSNPPFTTVTDFGRNVQFPFDFDDLFAQSGGSTPTAELIDYQGLQPYRIQWNLNVQREIVPNTTLTVGYVGARGVDLFRIWNMNQVDPVPSTDPSRPTPFYFPDPAKPVQNPNFGPLVQRSGGADSWYHALQLSVIKRFSSRFQFQGSYTWGKSLDTSSKSIRGNGESRNTTNQMNPLNPGWREGGIGFRRRSNAVDQRRRAAAWRDPVGRRRPNLGGLAIGNHHHRR